MAVVATAAVPWSAAVLRQWLFDSVVVVSAAVAVDDVAVAEESDAAAAPPAMDIRGGMRLWRRR